MFGAPGNGDSTKDSTKLIHHLLSNSDYNKDVRPVFNWSQPITVRVDIGFHEIVELVSKSVSRFTPQLCSIRVQLAIIFHVYNYDIKL
jgi:hypothetical protein